MSGDFSAAMLIPLLISGCGISLTAIVVLIYHFLIVQYCLGRQNPLREDTTLVFNNSDSVQPTKLGLDNSALALIPIVQYSAQMLNDMLKGNQSECAICLVDLDEGVSVRVLPNCRHAFHVKCIDQWLSSHVNCPFCRSEIFPFEFSEWIMEFEGGDDMEARRSGRCIPAYRSKNNPPGSGLGFIRKNINPMENPAITNNNMNDVIISTPSSSVTNVIDETSHIEINVAENENENNNNSNDENRPASSSTSFSSCSSSNGSMNVMSEDTISSQFEKMSSRLMRSLSQLRVAGWGSSSSTVVGGANSDSPC